MRAALFALLAAACFGTNTLPEHATPGTPRVQTVAAVREFDKWQWEASGYARPGEIVPYPVFVFVSDFGLACIVPGKDWALGQYWVKQLYSCAAGWRFRRPR